MIFGTQMNAEDTGLGKYKEIEWDTDEHKRTQIHSNDKNRRKDYRTRINTDERG